MAALLATRSRHGGRGSVFLLLMTAGVVAHAVGAPPSSMPPARWRGEGVEVEVSLGEAPGVATAQRPALIHYAVGLVAMPLAAIDPAVALGWPFYVVLGAPWQATFNARSSAVAQALGARPLPDAVVEALQARARPGPNAAPRRATLHLQAYGLATRSGRPLEAFGSGEDLCLSAQGVLAVAHDGGAAVERPLVVAAADRSPDAPPPACMPLARWAADDAKLVRQHLAELAEILAALTLERLGEPR